MRKEKKKYSSKWLLITEKKRKREGRMGDVGASSVEGTTSLVFLQSSFYGIIYKKQTEEYRRVII
jgi:hypothetical protein